MEHFKSFMKIQGDYLVRKVNVAKQISSRGDERSHKCNEKVSSDPRTYLTAIGHEAQVVFVQLIEELQKTSFLACQ